MVGIENVAATVILNLPPLRDVVTGMYDVPKTFYATGNHFGYVCERTPNWRRSSACRLRELGAMAWYAHVRAKDGHGGNSKRRRIMDVEGMAARWHLAVVQLALAHDKDDADKVEASIKDCLLPILGAPVAQIRDFADRLLVSLKADPKVPYLVWRGYEQYVELIVRNAPDGGIKELKTEAARAIADMVEEDIKPQLHEALVRALQWRSPEKLQEVAKVVSEEKAKGNKPRLRGRESCLFLESGGTEDEPKVCVQI